MGTHPIFESDFDCLTEMSDSTRIRRPGPNVSRGVYGFVMYVTAKSAFLIYILWAVVPQKFLDEHGLEDFFPSKYWALVFPVWIIIATIFIWLIYFAINANIASKHNFWEDLNKSEYTIDVVLS